MGGSSKVLTPRNVDLPMHVLRGNHSSIAIVNGMDNSHKSQKPHPRKKCLCLFSWLLGLLLLCAAVIVIANFLLSRSQFEDGANKRLILAGFGLAGNSGNVTVTPVTGCLEKRGGATLEEKIALTDLIVVGKTEESPPSAEDLGRVRVQEILKESSSSLSVRRHLEYVRPDTTSRCRSENTEKAIFFLTRSENESTWTLRFSPMNVSSKLRKLIRNLAGTHRAIETKDLESHSNKNSSAARGKTVIVLTSLEAQQMLTLSLAPPSP